MSRRFLVALVAMLAIFGAMIAAIWVATGPSAGAAAPAAGLAGGGGPGLDPAPPVTVRAPIDLGKAPLGGVPAPEYVIVKDQPPPAPASGSWEAVPILAARRGVIPLDLEDLRPRLAECFSPAIASRGGPVVEAKDAAPLQDEATTTLLLQLEVSGDALRVVEAPVESHGTATAGTLACAQGLLRGAVLPSPGLAPGRHRLRLALAP